MKEQINNAIEWIKQQPVKGCITGSCLLDYFEGQDVDVFMYDEKSFQKLLFAMHHNSMFTQIDPIEKWKFDQYINKNQDPYFKGLLTIKFDYNTCVSTNIVLKKRCQDIFSVLSSFDFAIREPAFRPGPPKEAPSYTPNGAYSASSANAVADSPASALSILA